MDVRSLATTFRVAVAMRYIPNAYYNWWQDDKCPLLDVGVKSWQGHQFQVLMCLLASNNE